MLLRRMVRTEQKPLASLENYLLCPDMIRSLDWHIREESLLSAQACLDNFVLGAPLARAWGDRTTSSSDGMRVIVGAKAANAERNAKYFGARRGVTMYSHAADICRPLRLQEEEKSA
jgi:TnpA family transposase